MGQHKRNPTALALASGELVQTQDEAPTGPACLTCPFWVRLEAATDTATEPEGECRGDTPKAVAVPVPARMGGMNLQVVTVFPRVKSNCFCAIHPFFDEPEPGEEAPAVIPG